MSLVVYYLFGTQCRCSVHLLKNFRPEPPPSVDRPTVLLFQAWFHHEMK